MKKIFKCAVAALIAVMGVSCNDESWEPESLVDVRGELSLSSLGVDVDTEDVVVPHSGIDISGYTVSIYDNDNRLVEQWQYADMPEIVSLVVGDYTIEVKSHELQDAEWEKPYYYGFGTFTIEKSSVTEPDDIICKLSNVKVSVKYSEALEAALGDDVTVNISIGSASLDYVKGEQRAGYFALPSTSSTLVATFNGSVNGSPVSLRKTFTDVEAGQHRIVTFSLSTGNVNPGIIVDAEITDEDVNVDVPGDDDVISGDRPEDGTEPTIESETLDLDGPNIVTADLIAKVDINAPKGVGTFFVEIISETLNAEVLESVGLASVFDLAHPGDLDEVLKELGFPTGDEVIGKTYLQFDITMFMELLAAFPGQHQFKLTVTDASGQTVTKTLTFLVE
ncbi:MAG: DUF4493 domain-containing protein [Muribaculaceae bacterium]|nr:DUF4493 domain-containing protein [Muribaculaceae bacterium]